MDTFSLRKIILIIIVLAALAGTAWLIAFLSERDNVPGSPSIVSLPSAPPSFVGTVQSISDNFLVLRDSRIKDNSLIPQVGVYRVTWNANTQFLKSIPERIKQGQMLGAAPGKGEVVSSSVIKPGASVLVYGAPRTGAEQSASAIVINP